MKNFDFFLEKMLLEMPHVSYGAEEIGYDLEVETYSPNEEGYGHLVTTVKDFLAHKPIKSRHPHREGIAFQLPEGEKESFVQALKDGVMLKGVLQKRFGKTLESFLNDVMVTK
jgi:hypothetical protein